jgi:hypothetical protein
MDEKLANFRKIPLAGKRKAPKGRKSPPGAFKLASSGKSIS